MRELSNNKSVYMTRRMPPLKDRKKETLKYQGVLLWHGIFRAARIDSFDTINCRLSETNGKSLQSQLLENKESRFRWR